MISMRHKYRSRENCGLRFVRGNVFFIIQVPYFRAKSVGIEEYTKGSNFLRKILTFRLLLLHLCFVKTSFNIHFIVIHPNKILIQVNFLSKYLVTHCRRFH